MMRKWKTEPYRAPELLGEAQRLLHAGRRLVQIAHHEATVDHDARFLAAANKAMGLVVVLHIAAIVVVFVHAFDDFDVTTFESNAE